MKTYIDQIVAEYKDAETVYKVGIWDKSTALEKFLDHTDGIIEEAGEDRHLGRNDMTTLESVRLSLYEQLEKMA